MEPQEITDRLSCIWHNFEEVVIAYLFGSRVTGEARRTSDIDIAVYAPDLSLDRYCRLWAQAVKALGTEKLDLVTLGDKPALFRYQVIKEGKVIYCKDEIILNEFEMKSWQGYMDSKHLRGIYLKHFYEGLGHGL